MEGEPADAPGWVPGPTTLLLDGAVDADHEPLAAATANFDKHKQHKAPPMAAKPQPWLYGPFGLISLVAMAFYWALTMVSKMSFLAMAEQLHVTRQGDKTAEATYVAFSFALILPLLWTVVYKFCEVGLSGKLFSLALIDVAIAIGLALLEAVGVGTFLFFVSARLTALNLLTLMPCIYFLPQTALWPTKTTPAAEPPPPAAALSFSSRTFGNPAWLWKLVRWLACCVQLICLILIPTLLHVEHYTSSYHRLPLFTCFSLICIGVAWAPWIHDSWLKALIARAKKHQANAYHHIVQDVHGDDAIVVNGHDHTEIVTLRVKSFWMAVFKAGAYLVFAFCYPMVDQAHWRQFFLPDALRELNQDNYTRNLLIAHMVSSFVAYHFGRLCLMVGLGRASSAVPLFFTPLLSYILPLLVSEKWRLVDITYHHALFHSAGLVTLGVAAYISEYISVWGTVWRDRQPRLVADESRYYAPAYCSPLLDHFTLINLRSCDNVTWSTLSQMSSQERLRKYELYICTTMYNEDKEEMLNLLRSVVAAGVALGPQLKRCQSHIFLDGGISGAEPTASALRLLQCAQEARKEYVDTYQVAVPTDGYIDNRRDTPYGAQIVLPMPSGFLVTIHMKDPDKVRKKKRWSQIMYMYYTLNYIKPENLNDAFILATDADIQFGPSDVTALLMMMARDPGVGAVCGRTFAIGNGPLVWYQKFDYAIGHWLQKAAEDVLGSVLCCPGCYSVYRLAAVVDVVYDYGSDVEKASEFLIKDMGEDRWFCTLLVAQGWRLEYCAVAKDSTFCPTTIKELYNQRRRWIVSTLANMIKLLTSDRREILRNNHSMSLLFIFYESLLLVSTVLSPATVLLIMISGFAYVFHVPLAAVFVPLALITVVYSCICLFGKQETQITASTLLTLVFALVMALVFFGLVAQLADNMHDALRHRHPHVGGNPGELSISTIYLLAMMGLFLVCGLLHLGEFVDLIHGIWYVLCLPSGYLLLLIYACCNLDDVSWGTRVAAKSQSQSVGSGGLKIQPWYRSLLMGCGLRAKERLWHFLGRVLCCEKWREDSETKAVEVENAVGHAGSKDGALMFWRVVPVLHAGQEEYTVVCLPIQALLDKLKEADPKAEEVAKLLYRVLVTVGSVAMQTALFQHPERAERLARAAELATLDASVLLAELATWMMTPDSRAPPLAYALANKDIASDMGALLQAVNENASQDFSQRANAALTTPNGFPDIASWLHEKGVVIEEDDVSHQLLAQALVIHGFDTVALLETLTDDNIENMNLSALRNGQLLVPKLQRALKSVPRAFPAQGPAGAFDVGTARVENWLTYMAMESYKPHMRWFGYLNEPLITLTKLKKADFVQMGIVKLGHLQLFTSSLQKLTPQLEGLAEGKEGEVHGGLAWKQLSKQELGVAEKDYWVLAVAEVLKPATIDRVALKAQEDALKKDLHDLRNMAVWSLAIINVMWLLMITVLDATATQRLRILNTNPLGIAFISLYGGLFVIQFLCMLVHRANTLVQFVANNTLIVALEVERPQDQEIVAVVAVVEPEAAVEDPVQEDLDDADDKMLT